jgi:hypothetical protein
MANVATLGIAVESGQVEKGARALDELTNSAAKAQAATSGVTSASNTAAAASTKLGASASAATTALRGEAIAAQNASRALMMHGTAASKSAVNVGNLAAQFQDIGVTLAMGMSPLQIALQQGTQIAAVLGPMGAAGAVRGLGAALLSVISPISLITIGLVAAGAAAAQYFFGINSESSNAEANLAKQEAMIGRVADKWGTAVPALREYVDQLQRANDVSDLQTVGGLKVAEDLASINAALDAFIGKNEDAVNAINMAYDATGRSTEALSRFAASWLDLEQKIRNGTATEQDFVNATSLMRSAVASSGGDLDAFGTGFETLASRIMSSIAALQRFQEQMRVSLNAGIAAQASIQNMTTGQINNPNLPDPNFRLPGEGPVPGSRPLIELEGPYSVASGSSATQSAYDSATKSMAEQTRALQAQTAAQAALNPLINDYGFAMTKAKAAADLLAAAERDKKAITPELTADINAQATALAAATAAQARQTEAVNNAKAAMEAAKGAATGFLSTMRQGLIAGEGWWRSFGNAAMSVLDKIMSAMETSFVNSLFTSSATGGVGIFGKLFGFAGGTDFAPGGMAVVGERGPEIVNLPRGSQVIPNHRIGSVAANQNIHVTSDIRVDMDPSGQWKANVKHVSTQTVQAAAPRIVGAAVTEAGRRVVPSLAKHQTQKAGGDWRNGG